jgi:hypothetical protein
MRGTFPAWSYTPASANGGFRPSLLGVTNGRANKRTNGNSVWDPRYTVCPFSACPVCENHFGRQLGRDFQAGVPWSRLHCPGFAGRAGPAVLVSVIAFDGAIRLFVQCRSKARGCQTLGAGRKMSPGTSAGPRGHEAFVQRTGRSALGTNGTSVIWAQTVQEAGCIWRGLRPPKLAEGP